MARVTHSLETVCPECGYLLDAHTVGIGNDSAPRPGDFTICINCAEILAFDEQLALRLTSLRERQDLPQGLFAVVEHIVARGRRKDI